MNKAEFLSVLQERLAGLPGEDLQERLNFYEEMLEDRMEDGLSEEDAVSAVGDPEEIGEQIVAEFPLVKLAKEKIKRKRRLKAWEIVLLALGFPVWGALLIAAVAVLLALYVTLWSVLISFWATFVAVLASGVAVVAAGIGFIFVNPLSGLAMIGAGLVCTGLSILFFFGCSTATKGVILLTRKLGLAIKHCFMKKEAA